MIAGYLIRRRAARRYARYEKARAEHLTGMMIEGGQRESEALRREYDLKAEIEMNAAAMEAGYAPVPPRRRR